MLTRSRQAWGATRVGVRSLTGGLGSPQSVQQCLERGDLGSIPQEDHSQADTLGFPCVCLFAHVLASMYVPNVREKLRTVYTIYK